MRRLTFQIVLLCFHAVLYASTCHKTTLESALQGSIPFITTWKTDNPGTSDGRSIRIPTAPGELYDYTVDWGDGSPPTVHTGDATHTYATPGTYTVSITGLFPRIFNGRQPQGDSEKLMSIEQWGNNVWTSMNGAFASCSNLVGNFTDIPDLSNVTDMEAMFSGCAVFNSDIGDWNVSTITSMAGAFADANAFDQNLGNWNVEAVTDFEDMFLGATLSTANYDALLIGWQAQNLRPNMVFHGGNSHYCLGEMARNTLVSDEGWTITDAGAATPVVNDIPHQTHVNAVVLPLITGSDLTGRERYYTGPMGTGTAYEAGTILLFDDFPTYPITLFIYDGTDSCASEQNFDLTLTTSCTPPTADSLLDVTACDAYTLPTLNAGNAYYTDTNAGGTPLNPGDNITSSQTVYIYTGSLGCSDESSFTVTITRPMADTLDDATVCHSFILPALSAGNSYYTDRDGGGNQLNAGDAITSTQTVYIYAGTPSCADETLFTITVTGGAMAATLPDTTECEPFILPPLPDGNNYYTGSDASGILLNAGDRITETQTLFVHTQNGDCWDETSFTITIDPDLCEPIVEESCSVAFPKFITPNGDGINDRFEMSRDTCMFRGELQVFDRFGKLVFQTTDIYRGWDGTFSGRPLPASDYWYRFYDAEKGEIIREHFALKR